MRSIKRKAAFHKPRKEARRLSYSRTCSACKLRGGGCGILPKKRLGTAHYFPACAFVSSSTLALAPTGSYLGMQLALRMHLSWAYATSRLLFTMRALLTFTFKSSWLHGV